MDNTGDLVRQLSAPVPRYTSYPTANHFSDQVGPAHYARWLEGIGAAAGLSLYLHIPFCHQMCWYCACSTKAVRRYAPVRRYVDALLEEIGIVADRLGDLRPVTHVHWGGGSPSILEPEDIARIAEALHGRFRIADDAEHAVEIDPRHLNAAQVGAFRRAGVNRVSFGVQDFAPEVQAAIGRLQSFEETKRAADLFRQCGIERINIDLVYGLPHQTRDSLSATVARVLDLAPSRIAVFGYAHLPSRVPGQRLIATAALPDAMARFEQAQLISEAIRAQGYVGVGIDHFARPDDALGQEGVHRNFQGYTSDAASTLLGFGASSIGRLADGYVQNAISAHAYERMIAAGGLATARGFVLSEDDRVRAYVIERLMCDFQVSTRALVDRFGEAARPVMARAAMLMNGGLEQLLAVTADGFEVTARGRPFVRTICAGFDRFIGGAAELAGRHSPAV